MEKIFFFDWDGVLGKRTTGKGTEAFEKICKQLEVGSWQLLHPLLTKEFHTEAEMLKVMLDVVPKTKQGSLQDLFAAEKLWEKNYQEAQDATPNIPLEILWSLKKKGYLLVLASDADTVHGNITPKKAPYFDFFGDDANFSCNLGATKQDKNFWFLMRQKYQKEYFEMVLIDDRLENINMIEDLGGIGILYQDVELFAHPLYKHLTQQKDSHPNTVHTVTGLVQMMKNLT